MSKQIELVLVHGWGFDSSFWQSWDVSNIGHGKMSIFDRGYFGNLHNIEVPKEEGFYRIVVAHSFGAHFLTPTYMETSDLCVLLGGFINFHANHQDRKSRATTRAMKAKLAVSTKQVLSDFYQICGYEMPQTQYTSPDNTLLANDLDLLDRSCLDIKSLRNINHILLLHGCNDKVSAFKQSELLLTALPQAILKYHPTAQHALPVTHYRWCLDEINQYLINYVSNLKCNMQFI